MASRRQGRDGQAHNLLCRAFSGPGQRDLASHARGYASSEFAVEMRAALLREACALLRIGNVRHQGAHALIDDELAAYSVHPGSAIVHRQPGGHLCIVPVHSQHRGWLLLPFADADPRTAEVVSKVILLARDEEIKNPTILEQILR